MMMINDPFMSVEVLSKTDRPNLLSYLAMHQDYSENDVFSEYDELANLSEQELGQRLVKHCIKYSHWGVIEHPSITFNVIGFPHSVLAQARTHRVGITFDCQSMRYTSKRFLECAEKIKNLSTSHQSAFKEIEKLIYFRPIGFYNDRNGNKYEYSEELRNSHIESCALKILEYYDSIINQGLAPEHARGIFVYDFRQHFVVSFNLRSLLHFLDLRHKADAQLEIQYLSHLLWKHCQRWVPEISAHYEKTRLNKNKLSP